MFLRVNSQEFRIIWTSVPCLSATVQCAENHVRVKVHTALYPCVLWSAGRSVSPHADPLFITAPFAHGQTRRKVLQIASWRRWAFRDLYLLTGKSTKSRQVRLWLLALWYCGLQVPWSFSDYWLCSLPGIQVHTLHYLIRLAHLIPVKLTLGNTEVNIGCSVNIQDCVFSTCLHWVALRTLLSVSSPLPLRGFHNGIKTHRLVVFAFLISSGGFLFYPDKKCL